jgi:cytochrome oxidase Cu insertion factor (SCO1/SenC/PrrC family)
MVKVLAFVALFAANAFVPLLHEGDAVPAFPLVDQSGHAFSIARLRGNAVILSFIYTRCADPAMCPLVSAKFERLQRAIGGEPIRLLELTLDPRFDTPQVLRLYGRAFGADPARWTLATGTPATLAELSARLGIASTWTRPGTLLHTEAAIVLDRDSTVVRIVDGNTWTPDAVLAVAREAAGARPAPFARLALWLTAAVQSCGGGTGSINVLEGLALLALLAAAIGAVVLRSLRPSRRR